MRRSIARHEFRRRRRVGRPTRNEHLRVCSQKCSQPTPNRQVTASKAERQKAKERVLAETRLSVYSRTRRPQLQPPPFLVAPKSRNGRGSRSGSCNAHRTVLHTRRPEIRFSTSISRLFSTDRQNDAHADDCRDDRAHVKRAIVAAAAAFGFCVRSGGFLLAEGRRWRFCENAPSTCTAQSLDWRPRRLGRVGQPIGGTRKNIAAKMRLQVSARFEA